jgi:hypothetical protein
MVRRIYRKAWGRSRTRGKGWLEEYTGRLGSGLGLETKDAKTFVMSDTSHTQLKTNFV